MAAAPLPAELMPITLYRVGLTGDTVPVPALASNPLLLHT